MSEWLGVKDQWARYSWYHKSINLLIIDYSQTHNSGTMTAWHLEGDMSSIGTTPEELIACLDISIPHTDKAVDYIIVVYIDRLEKITAWFAKYITGQFSNKYINVGHIQFRSYLDLNSALTNDTALEYIQYCYNNYFIKDKKWYLTMQQRTRFLLKQAPRPLAIPDSSASIPFIRSGFFGGLCYCPTPGAYYKDCLYADLDSAYIWALLTKQYPVSRPTLVDKIDNTKSHFGLYKVIYTSKTSIINRFKDIDGHRLKPGINMKCSMALNDIDISNLQRISECTLEAIRVWEFETDYISSELREILLYLYTEKCRLKPLNKTYKAQYGRDMPEYKAIKAQLNGVFGNLFPRTWDELNIDGKPIRRDRLAGYLYVSPYWAGYVTAYVFRLILSTGKAVQDWYYSDTDSMLCSNSEHNINIINKINDKIAQANAELGLPEHLGQFDIEHLIRLKTFKHKQYLYETKDGIYIKAAGCEVEQGTDLFDQDSIPRGRMLKRHTDNGYYETWINGDSIINIIKQVCN